MWFGAQREMDGLEKAGWVHPSVPRTWSGFSVRNWTAHEFRAAHLS